VLYCILLLGLAQGPELSILPPPLNADAEVLNAVEVLATNGNMESSRAAVQVLLKALPAATANAQAEFLCVALGNSVFPKGTDLSSTWLRIDSEWPELFNYLDNTIRSENDLAKLNGALLAAGSLNYSSVSMVEAIAARLNEVDSAEFSREALFSLTRHEFSGAEQFNKWWSTARNLSRATWLAQAYDSAHQRELELWAKLLAVDSSATLSASRSTIGGVRALAFTRMSELPPESTGEQSEIAKAVLAAFYSEHLPELRQDLIALIPRFLAADNAIPLLDQALEAKGAGERLAAARALVLVRPVEFARDGVSRHLRRVYVLSESGEPSDSPQFRSSLWSGLREVAKSWNTADSDLSLVLVRALDLEPNQQTRNDIYAASGALGWQELIAVLLPRAGDEELATEERSSALGALTRISLSSGESEDVLAVLHGLLAHEKLRYRAVQCLSELKSTTSAAPLASQLGQPMEDFVQQAILSALSDLPSSTEAIVSMLRFSPAEKFAASYVSALVNQVSHSNPEMFSSVVRGLEEKSQFALALKLLDAPLQTEIDELEVQIRARIYSRILALWLLQDQLPKGAENRIEDCRSRLQQQLNQDSENPAWAELMAKFIDKFPLPIQPEQDPSAPDSEEVPK